MPARRLPARPGRSQPAAAAMAAPACGRACGQLRPTRPATGAPLAPPRSRRASPGRASPSPASLNPTFTFASFVAGKANQLARAAGLQVADHPTSYNPLFVYGGVGLGKTHLIQAIGNQILHARAAARRSATSTPRRTCPTCVRAYQHKAFDDFKRYYRSLDLLLIDDIQFFGGKSRTQEEFFYTVQHADRGAQAGRHHLRHAIRRRSPASRSA